MIRTGTSGWYYDGWAGEFYPEDLPRGKWLEFYGEHFDAVEVNASFYRLPTRKMLESWKRRTGDDFVFVFKGSRLVTHRKRLKDVRGPLSRFHDRISLLKDRIGAVLWQAPGGMEKDLDRLEGFLDLLDRDYRHVMEFREESWFDEATYKLLREKDVSFCIVSCPDLPSVTEVTAEPAYLRFHGRDSWYSHDYSDQELGGWAGRIKLLGAEDTYCFFNNDQGAYAPRNCLSLRRMLEDRG